MTEIVFWLIIGRSIIEFLDEDGSDDGTGPYSGLIGVAGGGRRGSIGVEVVLVSVLLDAEPRRWQRLQLLEYSGRPGSFVDARLAIPPFVAGHRIRHR